MKHQPAIFTFTSMNNRKVSFVTKKYCFNIESIIDHAPLIHDLGGFAEKDLPLILEGFNPLDVLSTDENLKEAQKVFDYSRNLKCECVAEAELIRKRNRCFKWKDTDNDFRFDVKDYLSDQELKYYLIQNLCDNDPEVFEFTLNNYCCCEFTKFQASVLTDQIKEIQKQKHILSKIKK